MGKLKVKYTAFHFPFSEFDENFFSKRGDGTYTEDYSVKLQRSLFFIRLCPLLIIRLLPLRVLKNLKSSIVYGEIFNQHSDQDNRTSTINDTESVAALLLNRQGIQQV